MVMVRYAACPWTEVFAPCSAIVVSLNQRARHLIKEQRLGKRVAWLRRAARQWALTKTAIFGSICAL